MSTESILSRYSNEALAADLAGSAAGPRNAAGYLLKLDTPARRFRVVSEAHTLMNILGFRYSEAVCDASRTLARNIAAGIEEAELYGEGVARADRERQQAMREAGFPVS